VRTRYDFEFKARIELRERIGVLEARDARRVIALTENARWVSVGNR